MSSNEQFTVQTEQRGEACIVRPSGDIDLSHSPILRTELAQVQKDRPEKLIVDLSRVPYMDSSGVATFVEAMQIARRHGSQLVLCHMQEKVKAIFEIARLDMVFTIVDDTEKAMTV